MLLCLKIIFSVPEKLRLNSAKTPIHLVDIYPLTVNLSKPENTIAPILIFCLKHLNLCLKTTILCLKVMLLVLEKLFLFSAKTPGCLVSTHGQPQWLRDHYRIYLDFLLELFEFMLENHVLMVEKVFL